MTTRLIGVDPGLAGALALLEDGELLEVVDMPVAGGVDPHGVTTILAGWGAVERVVIEAVSTRPGQAAGATLKTGIGWGVLVGVCAALERPMHVVTPTQWTRALGVGKDKGDHRRRAMDLWPTHSEPFRRVKDDGRADAALIARWCYERYASVGAAGVAG